MLVFGYPRRKSLAIATKKSPAFRRGFSIVKGKFDAEGKPVGGPLQPTQRASSGLDARQLTGIGDSGAVRDVSASVCRELDARATESTASRV